MAKNSLTIDVKKLKKEFYEGRKELNKEHIKFMEETRELKESQRKTDEQLKKTDEKIDKLIEEQRKTDEQMRKTDKEIDKVNKMVGNLTDGWGKFVEGLVAPSVPKLFKTYGIHIEQLSQRTKRILNGETYEVDILSKGKRDNKKEVIILTSVKSNLKKEDIDDLLEDMKENFFKFFKEYKGKEVICSIAGIRLQTGIEKYAEKCGLYILAPSGDTMKILNREGFKPKIWR